MSIKFICTCGKHLRAGDTLAGKHTLCPQCGALVAIPAAGAVQTVPTQTPPSRHRPRPAQSSEPVTDWDGEEVGPVLVRVRSKKTDPNRHTSSVWVPLDPERGPPPAKLPRPVKKSARRYNWQLELHWYESLNYPFRAWKLLAVLAIAQAAVLTGIVILEPEFVSGNSGGTAPQLLAVTVLALLLFTYCVGFLDGVLASAVAGEYRLVPIPGLDLGARGLLTWTGCFCVGPIVPGVAAGWYWLHGGDYDWLDRTILFELAAFATGWWLLAVVAVHQHGNWTASNPIDVLSVLTRIGPAVLVPAFVAPLIGYGYAMLLNTGLEAVHRGRWLGPPRLAFATFLALMASTFLVRMFGVWTYKAMPALHRDDEP